MKEYRSKTVEINQMISEVVEVLANPENFRPLLPPSIKEFSPTEKGVIMDIKGLGKIDFVFTDKGPEKITLTPVSKTPFPFYLQWNLKEKGESTQVEALIAAEMNLMMRMMAEKLLTDVLDHQIENVKGLFND